MADDDINSVNDPWNQYRNIIGIPSRRRIAVGTACIIFVLTLIVIAFAVMSNQDKPKNLRLPYASFHSALNVSVDPCVDFYNFSCGLWTQNNPISEDKVRVTTFNILQEIVDKKKKTIFENAKLSNDLPRVVNNAISFYNICSHQSNANNNSDIDIELLLQYFDQIGGWPILNNSEWDESSFDWFQSSAFLIKYLDLHTIIGVYSLDSDKNGGRNVIYLKPSNVLKDEDIAMHDIAFFRMNYAILESLNNSNIHSDIWDDIESLKASVNKWQKLLSFSHNTTDPLFMSIKKLSQEIPEIDWLKYLQLITNDTLLQINEIVTINDTIAIDNLDFLKKVVDIMASDTFSKMELANLFGWFAVKDIWILIPGVLQNYAKLNNYDSDDMKMAANNKCYDFVLELFPCSLDYLYVKNVSHAGIQDSVVLTSYIKSSFQYIIQKSDWLDEVTKKSVLNRLNSMKDFIGFPSYLNNKTEFDEMYKDFPMMVEYSLGCYFQTVQFYVKMRIMYLKVPTNRLKFILPRSVSDVSAYYIVNKNALVYPISLHNPPFYYFEGPWYLNFGAVGSVIGHEMMHGFDNFGTNGIDLNVTWLSNTARMLYHKHAACFKDQYSVYDSSGLYNNGTRTLRENIADTEGLRLAFEAYKKHEKDSGPDKKYETLNNYTPDQMFFISYGTVWCSKINPSMKKEVVTGSHSLPKLRVNRAVSNAESFAVAFNCPKGSPMNPIKKCSIW